MLNARDARLGRRSHVLIVAGAKRPAMRWRALLAIVAGAKGLSERVLHDSVSTKFQAHHLVHICKCDVQDFRPEQLDKF